jgi:hypothetical protein
MKVPSRQRGSSCRRAVMVSRPEKMCASVPCRLKKPGFKPEAQQPAGRAEIVVRRGGEQMHKRRIAMDQRQNVTLEGVAVGAIAELDACHQVGVRRQQLVHRHGREAGIGR